MKKHQLFLVILFTGVLSACGSGSPFAQLTSGNNTPTIEQTLEGEYSQLILSPIEVWDEQNVTAPELTNVNGYEIFVRRRETHVFEKPYVRAGLFWNSRLPHAFLPIVVLGPKADINGVSVRAGKIYQSLRPARNFSFTPTKSKWETQPLSSATFEIEPALLRAIADEKTAQLTIKTNRGTLRVGLDVVSIIDTLGIDNNARVWFAQFMDRMTEAQQP